MSAPSEHAQVVLRHALLHADAVHIRRRARPLEASTPAQDIAGGPALARGAADGGEAQRIGQAEGLLEQALARARAEGTRLGREEGLRAGYDDGFRKGEAQAASEQGAALAQAIEEATATLHARERQLAALAAALSQEQSRWQALAEEDAVLLAYELACRIVGQALVTPEGVGAQAQLVRASARETGATFHVHPDDARVLQGGAGESELRWRADPQVALGGCMLHGSAGTLDARLETVLQQCLHALQEVRAAGPGAGPAA